MEDLMVKCRSWATAAWEVQLAKPKNLKVGKYLFQNVISLLKTPK
jgi:hypothetical protein